MANEDKIALLKRMLGNTDNGGDWSDDTLLAFLDIAGAKIVRRAYPFENDKEVPEKYNTLQCEIAIYLLNKRGAEGETSHSENGISRSYESADVPESMLKCVTPYCGVV